MPGKQLRSGTHVAAAAKQGRAGRQWFSKQQENPWKKRRSERLLGLPATTVLGTLDDADDEDDRKPAALAEPRILRSSVITCCIYGPDRKIRFPGYYMCDHCDDWEMNSVHYSANANRTSRRHHCRAKHTDPRYPNQLLGSYLPSKKFGSQAVEPTNCKDLYLVEDEADLSWDDSSFSDDSDPDMPKLMGRDEMRTSPFDDDSDDDSDDDRSYGSTGTEDHSHVASLDGSYVSVSAEELEFCSSTSTNRSDCKTLEEEIAFLRERVNAEESRSARMAERHHRVRESRSRLLIDKAALQNEKGRLTMDNTNLKRIIRERKVGTCDDDEQGSLEDHLTRHLDIAMRTHTQGRRTAVFGHTLAKVAYSYREGIATNAIVGIVKDEIRETTFSPWKVARAMDLHGGTLNLQALEILRSLETQGKKYCRDTLIPSTHQMQTVFSKMEAMGDEVVPFSVSELVDGEAIDFDERQATIMALEGFGLGEAAKERAVGVSASIDGANLTKYLCHVMAGIKIKDHAATNPLTGVSLFCDDKTTAQSRNACIPLAVHMGREKGEKYDEFNGMFGFCQEAARTGLKEEWQPFNFSVNADMSAQWKGLGRGGGSNATTHPCHCCPINKNDLHHYNTRLCHRWCHDVGPDDTEWRCYHHDIISDGALERMEGELLVLQQTLDAHMQKLTPSQMSTEDPANSMGLEAARTNSTSIWFVPTTTRQRVRYSQLLNNELKLRGAQTVTGNLTSRREQLREFLKMEFHFRKLQREVAASKRPMTALFLLMQAVPCILHMENRVSLKIITMVLLEGLSNAKEGTLPLCAGERSEVRRIEGYLAEVEAIMNRSIMGSVLEPAQWKCPYEAADKKLGTLKLENWRARKVVGKLELLVMISVPDIERQVRWLRLLPKYRAFMVQARAKEDWNTIAELSQFQKTVDTWFQDWVSLHGADGMTNYIHMLSSGHMSDYVFHWGNLYEHSQQGWEAFNSLLKTFFFRRTARGGGRSKSRLRPVGRWLQRRLLWFCGYDRASWETFQKNKVLRREAEAASRHERSSDDDDDDDDDDDEQQEGDELDGFLANGLA